MPNWLGSMLEYILDFSNVLNTSISAGWLILVVMGLRLALKKAPKWFHVALWGIVALRLLMPLSIESVFSLIPSAQTVSRQIMQAGPVPGTQPAYLEIVTNPSFGGTVTVELDRSISAFQWDMVSLTFLWLGGMCLMALYTAVSYWLLRKKVETAVRLRENIFQCETVPSPCVLGLLKPRIYLPFDMDKQNREHVIAHERAHIRRKDHWWKPLGFLLLTVHWFNPLMWAAYILLCRDIELACDEKVIGSLGHEQRAEYTQALVACSVSRFHVAACPLAFGEVGVKERVRSIMNYRKPTFWIMVAAVAVCVGVAVCFLTNPTPSPEFPMTGNNVRDLNVDKILDRIFAYEDISNSNVYMNSANFSMTVDSDFNWVDSQAIRYFFWEDHKTQSAQLRIFPDENKYFLTESGEWTEQNRIFLLRYYLEALKYLPQEAIAKLAPADRYQILHIDGGQPDDFDRVITYSSEGVGETDGWYLHLRLEPLHALSDGGFHGTGDEVVELFYGSSKSKNDVMPAESKLFTNAGQDSVTVVSSVLDLENRVTQNGDILILQNEGGLWRFTEGQQVDVSVVFTNDGSYMSMKSVGYIYCGDGSQGIYAKEIISDQNVPQSKGSFTVSESGNYLFYFSNTSSSWIKLTDFDVAVGGGFDGSLADVNRLVIRHSDSETGLPIEKIIEEPEMISTIRSMCESLRVSEYNRPLSDERMVIQFYLDEQLVLEWYVSYCEEDDVVVTSCDLFGLGNWKVTGDFSYDRLLELFNQAKISAAYFVPTQTKLQGLHAGALLVPIDGNIYRYMLSEYEPEGITVKELLFEFEEPLSNDSIHWSVYSLKEYPDHLAVLMLSDREDAWLCRYQPPQACADTALETAIHGGCAVMEDGLATHGKEIWDEFYDLTQQGKPASVTVAQYYTLDPQDCDDVYYEVFRQDYPRLYEYRLEYDGKLFTLTEPDDGEGISRSFAYLMKYDNTEFYSQSSQTSGRRFDYVLTQDNRITWDQIWTAMITSYTGDNIEHCSVYSERIP